MTGMTIGGGPRTDGVCGYLAEGRVSDDLMVSLREHGMASPIRGIRDPRLAYPEMLIIGGWERCEKDDGYEYTFVADSENSSGLRWEQSFEDRGDGTSVLTTRAGRKVQVVTESPEGKVSSQVKNL